jgi:hypothetical protein
MAAVALLALLASACGSSGSPTPVPPPSSPPTVAPSEAASPSSLPTLAPTDGATPSAGSGTVTLHGTFTGKHSDSHATADMTATFDVQWNFGPDDVHDMNAFTFLPGSFTSAVSIQGDCGGSRDALGSLTPAAGDTLSSGALQDQDYARVVMVDQRLSSGALEFSAFSSYYVQGPDPAGCADSSKFGTAGCPMKFQWLAIGKLQEDATCADSSRGIQWTGHLAP